MSANPGSPMMTDVMPDGCRVTSKPFEELTVTELYEMLRLRSEVFVVEQECAYQDIDGKDPGSWQVMVFDDSGELVAGLRVLRPGVSFPEASLGRVVTRFRSKGYGAVAMREGIRIACEQYGAETLHIEAQCHAIGFYERFGFRVDSTEFLEDGIPHVEMVASYPMIGNYGGGGLNRLRTRLWATKTGLHSGHTPKTSRIVDMMESHG